MAIPLLSRWYRRSSEFWRHLLQRDTAEPGPVELGSRRVYIIPTRAGLLYALILLAMLIGAINYANSLAFALTFLLASLGMVAMVYTFRNLHRIRVRGGHPQAVFAGQGVSFPLNIDNADGPERLGLNVQLPGQPPVTLDLAAGANQWVELATPTQRRGFLPLPRVTLYTRYPLGLFHAWGYAKLALEVLVYPQPAPPHGLPPEILGESGALGDQGSGHDDFAALRPYHPGDSLRHVYWKALAREQGVLTKQFGGNQVEQLWLHWDLLPNMDTEARLSRLCRWVLEADTAGYSYGLALPGWEATPAKGDAHRRRCLEALALYQLPRREDDNGQG